MKLWIARNKSKVIKLFTIEPEYNSISDEWKGYDFEEIELSVLNFPKVTFENSPQQVEIKLVKEGVNMTQDEIVKYTDHLLAEFYKNCQKQYNKENRQTDIILSNGDFSTLQNMMCEAITNIQRQSVEKACDWLVGNAEDSVESALYLVAKFKRAMEE